MPDKFLGGGVFDLRVKCGGPLSDLPQGYEGSIGYFCVASTWYMVRTTHHIF